MNQDKIWNYFETEENLEIFSGAVPRLNYILKQAAKVCNKTNPTILNIGVGNAWLEKQCYNQGWKTYALDPSEEAIAMLEKIRINGKVGYVEKIPYPDDFFDIVFCSEVIEHLSKEQIHLGMLEIKRVLNQKGILIGTVPYNEDLLKNKVVCPCCGEVFHKWGHQQSFDKKSLNQIISQVLKVEKISIIYFSIWTSNWKGILTTLTKKILSVIGIHGSEENLFFIAKP